MYLSLFQYISVTSVLIHTVIKMAVSCLLRARDFGIRLLSLNSMYSGWDDRIWIREVILFDDRSS